MIGIIILNYNNWIETKKCIKSINNSNIKEDYHIYVVDNASDKIEFYKNKKVSLIISDKNRGYAAGNNLGIERALEDGCDAILISNNDVYYKENTIDKMYQYAKKYGGIIGTKIILANGKEQEINLGIKMGLKEKYMYLLRKTPLSFLVKHIVSRINLSYYKENRPIPVFGVSGCSFMMWGKCAKSITPFDENTFLYEEESIIGLSMQKKGFSTMYCPDIEVIHKHGSTTKNKKAFSYICFVESELYYCLKCLKCNKVEVFPLYLIRTAVYLKNISKKDYRRNWKRYKESYYKFFVQ